MSPGDEVMGLPIPEGGHLTHGWASTFPGPIISASPMGCTKRRSNDYDRERETATRERPKLIWVGRTAYPLVFDYAWASVHYGTQI
ncbi:hypothetical protein HB777_36215 (plasmid) [Mesorhizobium loti]|nr:hypothetical protein HB777_36215 [Mesorhizobium loti]